LWLFWHKHNADGSLNRYKAHLVANGSSQLADIDVDETFSPVVKPTTIRTVLSLAISRHWPVHQLDVTNAFLNGHLFEIVYMQQPSGFQDSQHPDYKYATEVLERAGMLTCNPCRTPVDTDSKLSADGDPVSDPTLYRSLAGALQYLTFTWPDISYAVEQACLVANGSSQLEGIDVDETFSPVVKPKTIRTVLSLAIFRYWSVHQLDRSLYGLKQAPRAWFQRFATFSSVDYYFSSRRKYATKALERAGMLTCNPSRTPVDTDSKLSADGDLIFDPTLYRSLPGALQYFTFIRPDISYSVQQLYSSTTSTLVAYSDVDWAGCPTTHRSTSSYCVFLGNNVLSWSSKRQFTISRSSAEAEYQGVANAIAETCWLCNLLRELHTPLSTATLFYYDNVSVVYLSSNPMQHQRTKHIEIDIHFVRDLVSTGRIRVLHVPSHYQYADIFTKGLPKTLFDEFRSSLSIRSSLAQTAGGC
nr:ribonuclease H-like domain-containing protein [Tanacetum cinerariifolium]